MPKTMVGRPFLFGREALRKFNQVRDAHPAQSFYRFIIVIFSDN
jgi:hypothetical protein